MKVFTVKAFRELRELKKTATNSATNKKETLESVDYQGFQLTKVIPLGLEPKTHTLKVYCSTN